MQNKALLFVILITSCVLIGVDNIMAQGPATSRIELFVSLTGQDADPGTKEQPFATLNRALEELQRLDAGHEVHIYLREGIYPIEKTIFIRPHSQAQVVIANYPGETVVFSGGVSIGGWEQHQGDIYVAEVSKGLDFRQLYVNGQKAVRARHPNGRTHLVLPTDKQTDGFNVQKGLVDDLPSLQGVEMSVFTKWMHKRLRIDKIYPVSGFTRVAIQPLEWYAINHEPQGTRDYLSAGYWFENSLAFLDVPGEWYLDQANSKLYYYKYPHEDLTTATVVAPRLETILYFAGSLNQPVKNVSISGITFQYTNWDYPNKFGFVDVQANTLVPSPFSSSYDTQYRHNQRKDRIPPAIYGSFAQNIQITNCVFENLGGTGITFEHGVTDLLIEGNVFRVIAGNGIEIGSDANRLRNSEMWPRRVTIRNNYLTKVADDYSGGVGILAFYVDTLTISHNHVSDVPYSGISAGWGWADSEAVLEARNYTITNNRVEKFCQLLSDGGGIYVTNPVYGENVIRGNYIIGDNRSRYSNVVIMGIYHDGASANWLTTENVIEHVNNWWIGGMSFGQQNKRDIRVENNFTTGINIRLNGENVTFLNNQVYRDANWPETAQRIIAQAGLSPEWEYIKDRQQ